MDEDMKEMIWESEHNSQLQHNYKAHFKDSAQGSFSAYNYEVSVLFQCTPVQPLRFERVMIKSLQKPLFQSEILKGEKMTSVNNTTSTPSVDFLRAKQNGNGHPSIYPAQFAFSPKERPAKNAHVETRTLSGATISVTGRSNHTLSSAFEKSFPIKNATCSTPWSSANRRSPKKMQRRQLSTVEETVREDEKELYRQLLQAVTGKSFFPTKPMSFLPTQVSRCLSSCIVSAPPVTSSLSCLEHSHLNLEPSWQPSFSSTLLDLTSTPLLSDDADIKPTCEISEVNSHQLQRQQSHPIQEQHEDSDTDSVIIVDSVIKDDHTRLQERAVNDNINLKLRVPLEKEIPVTLPPKPKKEPVQEEPEFPELTQEMEKEIRYALFGGSQDQVLSEGFRLTITRKDIMTLHKTNWLNDEVINFYMNLLMERSKRKGLPKVHAFNTFFFPKLKSAGFQAVKRWTKKVDVFSVDILLFPIHLGVHWCLAVIDFRRKTITYYDSMGDPNDEACKLLLQYLKLESQDKKGVCFDCNGWTLSSKKRHEIPPQLNGSDCGMFACKYAEYIAKDKPITFTQHNMPYFRKRMIWEILHQKLL
ncbi:sentrin-specific protease 1 [Pyxicephalus adspersus]|uniref:sentrin-specific protease 1 n=1 Tax=Pyxicephalus adspersus TaxID=30357 RepID=UPI003B5C2B29